MKLIKSKKMYCVVAFALCITFFSSAVLLSYLYGRSKSSVKAYSTLMSVDHKVKEQKYTNFLHGTLSFETQTSPRDEYSLFLETQRKTKTFYEYYNSFLVSSYEGGFINYSVDYKISSLSDSSVNLLEVCTYYDYNFMESIGLPLYKISDAPTGINPKNGAQMGAYISAEHAEEIVRNNGIYNDCNQNLEESFSKLLTDDNYVFSISSPQYNEGETLTFSINGIYLDSKHSFLFNDFQKKVQTSRFGDYSKSFDYWFDNPIFTFSTTIFEKGSSFVFDVRRNYGNLDRFFSNVVGYEYATNNLSITLFSEEATAIHESNVLNSISKNYNSKPNYIFLILSICLFFASGLTFEIFYRYLNKKELIFLSLSPLIVFSLIQIVFCVSLVASGNYLSLYLFFNTAGNIISLVSIGVLLLNSFVWSFYVKNNNK